MRDMLILRRNKMSYYEGKTEVSVELAIENDLEVDLNGNFYLVNLVFVGDAEEPTEIRVEFEDIVENMIDYYRDMPNNGLGYGQLYSIANEFERYIDRLREIAGYMEDSTIYSKLDELEDTDECL